jgi:hypothetical protein
MAARKRRVRAMSCEARALRAPEDRGEYRGRLFFGYLLLAKQKKVTAPRHERDRNIRTRSAKNNLGWYQFVVG